MKAASPHRLVLFGPPGLVVPGGRHEFPETAPAYLGLYLAARGGWVARESVAAFLWPDAATERAQHNLRVALNRLGALLQQWGVHDALQAERRRLRLDIPSDLDDFRQHLAAGDWAAASERPAGPLLDGLQFSSYPALAEWLEIEREALRRAWRKCLLEAARQGAAIDGPLGRFVAAYPADADAASLLAARLSAAGRPEQAQDVIGAFRRAAADELSPDELEASLRRIEDTTAALAAPGPQAEAALLGVHDALARLAHTLARQRWVTVVGLPGAGKSSLLRAWLAQARHADPALRAVRAELNSSSTVPALAEALAAGLGSAPGPRDDTAQLLQRLATLQGLVLLDGLDPGEQDPALSPLLRHLATGCPGLRVLCASRAPLGVPGEHLHRLQGLSLVRAADGGASDAARLFLREAQRIRPSHAWAQRADDAETIARLCGGLPLALKLAASWSRWLAPPAVAAELQRHPRDAAGGLGGALHGWLAATWQRLPAAQQQVLGALSLFPGSFDMRSAVAVAACAAAEVEALVAQCLVELEDGVPERLRLHALVRGFAAGRLAAAPAQRREAIARYLDAVDGLLGPRRSEGGLILFEAVAVVSCIDDVVHAWPLALETGARASMQALAAALLAWHDAKGEHRAGERQLARALEALDATLPAEAAVLAPIQAARATLLYRASDYDAAEAVALQAQQLASATGQRHVARRAANVLGLSRWMALRLDDARAVFEQALQSAIDDGDARGEATFSGNLSLVENALGHYEAAQARLRHVLALNRAAENWSSVCNGLNNLANWLRRDGRFGESEAAALECLRLTHEHGLDSQRPFALIGLALLHHATGRTASAEQTLDLLEAHAGGDAEAPVRAGAAQLRARIALDRRDGAQALQHVAGALRIGIASDDAANRAEALVLYGHWLADHAGRSDEALRLWQALEASAALQAELRDQLRALLAGQRHTAPADATPTSDSLLALAAEQALAEAQRLAATATPSA